MNHLFPFSPRTSPRAALLAAFLCLLAPLAALPAAGQDDTAGDAAAADGEAGDDLFIEAIDVNVVNVEVYVTGRDGERITGLTKDDFVLSVDRVPVPISNFYAVENGRLPGGDAASAVAEVEAEEADESADAESPEVPDRRLGFEDTRPAEQKLHLIVYVDNFNLRPFSRNRVIRAARTFLRSQMQAGDEVMLVTYDRSLKVRHPFTTDPELIASALYEIEEFTGYRVHQDSDRRDMLDLIYDQADQLYEVSGRARQYAESIYNDMSFALDALRDQVDMLAGLPGRKAILYVADGLPMRPGQDVFWALNNRFNDTSVLMEGHRFDMSREFQSLISQANTNRVTFYTVDAAGLRTYTYMDASNAGIGGGAQVDQVYFSNLQSPLLFMAEETGGFAVINTNNFGQGLEKMAEDFTTYYSLGFVPSSGVAGRYHRIKVELKDDPRGVDVRHREGYRDRPVSSRMADSALAALNFGFRQDDLGLEVETGTATRQDNGQFLVPLIVKVPIGKLIFLENEGMHRGRMRLYVAAKDTEGGMAEVQEVPVPIDIPSADYPRAQEQFYHYKLTLLMRPGRQMVAVGVRDEIGATTGFVLQPVVIGGD